MLPGVPEQPVTKPAESEEQGPLFKWETLREIHPHTLQYKGGPPIQGKIFEVELTSGHKVRVWRAEDGAHYYCHGLTFGGKDAPGGIVSPLGNDVPIILRNHYNLIEAEARAKAGDILVWRGIEANDVIHTAILTDPVLAEGKNYFAPSARVQTKNGIEPETNMELKTIFEQYYGESYNVYRRK